MPKREYIPPVFINIVDKEGRQSSLMVGKRDEVGYLRVVGGLEHSAVIQPVTKNDAMVLRDWLTGFILEIDN